MKRPSVPIEFVAGERINGYYVGWPPSKRKIYVTWRAMELLTKEQIFALVTHEVGHRELYHIERDVVLTALGMALPLLAMILLIERGLLVAVFVSFSLAVFLLALRSAHRCLCELEADAYAARHAGARHVASMFEQLAKFQPDFFSGGLPRLRRWLAKRRV